MNLAFEICVSTYVLNSQSRLQDTLYLQYLYGHGFTHLTYFSYVAAMWQHLQNESTRNGLGIHSVT